jgi:hypothetical protein
MVHNFTYTGLIKIGSEDIPYRHLTREKDSLGVTDLRKGQRIGGLSGGRTVPVNHSDSTD